MLRVNVFFAVTLLSAIPYSNLGTVIPELFVSLDIISSEGAMKPTGSSCDTLLQALLSNALQVRSLT